MKQTMKSPNNISPGDGDLIPNNEPGWREVLQHLKLNAAASRSSQDLIDPEVITCTGLLARNGYELRNAGDPGFIEQGAQAIANCHPTQAHGLVLPQTVSAAFKSAPGDMVRAYHECQKQAAKHESISALTARTVGVPVTPKPATAQTDEPISAARCPPGISENGSAALSYDELIAAHSGGRPHVKTKTIQNEISSLRRLITCLGQNGADDCRWMADQREFEKGVAACKLDSDGTFRSALNQLRRSACERVALANPVNTLWESYQRAYYKYVNTGGSAQLMSKNEFILHCFNATGISRHRLNAQKILVHGPTFERIKQLEQSLGADGELTQWLINMSDNNMKIFQTKYGKRVGEATEFRYALLRRDWPPGLAREWDDLFLFRTEPLRASIKWDLHLEEIPKKKTYLWRVRKHENSCPSADKQLRELECFFGWCLLPRETLVNGEKNLWRSGPDETIRKENLSLALIANTDLLDGYIKFRKAHTVTEAEATSGELGSFNRSCKTFIELASSLLNPLVGFIYLRKEFYFRPSETSPAATNLASRVGYRFYKAELRKVVEVTDPDERWYYFCKKIRDYMERTQDQEFDPLLKTRGGDPIAGILSLDDPMQAIVELLQRLEEAEPVVDHWRHFHRRKRLFFLLIANCPLRILQYALMTGNHLVKMKPIGGRPSFYQIRFTKEEFKNERYIPEWDYLFDLSEDLTSFIDSYLQNDWPAINGRPFTAEDRVFCGHLLGEIPQNRKTLTERIITQLMKICRETTARHLGAKYSTPGFYPHAFRHIEATSIIKVTGSYEEAALLLWDAVATVRRAYAHIKRVDQLGKVSRNHYARMSRGLEKARGLYLLQSKQA